MKKIILALAILASFFIEYSLFVTGDINFDIWGIFSFLISISFKVGASIYLYKECIGWNKFENSEGFSLKRKK